VTPSVGSQIAGGQILGSRKRQEDDFGVLYQDADDRIFFALADGMGGHAGGTEAAQTAIRVFLEVAQSGSGPTNAILEHIAMTANEAIGNLTRTDSSLEGAGCTFIAAAIEGQKLSWVSVGDSSVLLFRDGQVERLNEDHSMRPVLAEMVALGRLDRADAERHPNRNALRSALTGEGIELIDVRAAFPLKAGDQVLLTSDGIDILDYSTLAVLMRRTAGLMAAEAVSALLSKVEDAKVPHQDNATVVLYRNGKAPEVRGISRAILWWCTIAVVLFLATAAGVGWGAMRESIASWGVMQKNGR
jgi:serine/threonine protein phosphatase PrpC